jgi:ParB family chromosome partitioning protein
VEELMKSGREASIKNLENLLKEKEGRGGEVISPQGKRIKESKVSVDLNILPPKKREAFIRDLHLLKKRYGLI